ncbi:amidohydrolase family protein [Streptomyces sp. 16-176A]|uniref:amidohydrolase family protein n=1 Tax=Streptomyces sp. 16-176A TaxID=2530458 RepID=UPI00345DD68A
MAAQGIASAYRSVVQSVAALHDAGVPILAGTDADAQPGALFQVEHGVGIHHELELLVEAGLTPVEALRSATVPPARHFGLDDRGAVEPGLRADLLLIDGNPLVDIRATRAVRQVRCAGVGRSRVSEDRDRVRSRRQAGCGQVVSPARRA